MFIKKASIVTNIDEKWMQENVGHIRFSLFGWSEVLHTWTLDTCVKIDTGFRVDTWNSHPLHEYSQYVRICYAHTVILKTMLVCLRIKWSAYRMWTPGVIYVWKLSRCVPWQFKYCRQAPCFGPFRTKQLCNVHCVVCCVQFVYRTLVCYVFKQKKSRKEKHTMLSETNRP